MATSYKTPFTCHTCHEHEFETEAELLSEKDLIGAVCTHCGLVLTEEEITAQMQEISPASVQSMIANARQL